MDQVYEEFKFPFDPHEYQNEGFNEAIEEDKYGLWWGVGLGKTFMSTVVGLQHAITSDIETLMFIVPSSLVFQWEMWFNSIKFSDGSDLDVVSYQGSPAQRKKLNFKHDIIIMSHNIFRQDYKRMVLEMSRNPNIFVVYDEAHMGLRRAGNKIWRYFKNFTANKRILLLSATPIGNPMDTYAITKLLSPGLYKNKRHFENLHVQDTDFFGQVTEWKNMDLLHKCLYANASKLEPREVLDMPDVLYDKVVYELGKKHMKLYEELVENEMLSDDDGDLITALDGVNRFHTLQRFVTAPAKLNISIVKANVHKLIETIYNEDDSKLAIFANYRNTNQGILEFLNDKGINTVGCWGDTPKKQKEQNLKNFMFDDETRVLVGNPMSMGVGLNLQESCHRILFAELPLAPREFYQSVGRVDRQGQKYTVIVKALVADGTIQANLWWAMMNKDDLVNKIVKNRQLLRDLFT